MEPDLRHPCHLFHAVAGNDGVIPRTVMIMSAALPAASAGLPVLYNKGAAR